MGTNRLLRDGAEPLLEVADLLRHYPELGDAVAPGSVATGAVPVPPDLTGEESLVFGLLGAGPLGLDDLVARSSLTAPRLLTVVTTLELKGHLAQRGGQLALIRG